MWEPGDGTCGPINVLTVGFGGAFWALGTEQRLIIGLDTPQYLNPLF